MEQILEKANSFPMYLLAVIIVCGVLIQAVLYLKKAWKHGKEIGMDEQVMKQAVQSSVSFTIVPSIGILIGVLALAPSLGIPIPWIRLSVLGALHYESSTANNLAKGLGIGELPSNMMTAGDYASIVLGMSVTILSGLIFTLFFFRKYQNRILNKAKGDPKASDILLSSMFIGISRRCSVLSQIGAGIRRNKNTEYPSAHRFRHCYGSDVILPDADQEETDQVAGELCIILQHADRNGMCRSRPVPVPRHEHIPVR